jgi:glycerol-3-phosphate acyltransferase PlsY
LTQTLTFIAVLVISYLLGAIPFGLIIVWLLTKKDIRTIESGRTGGTNVWRAVGIFAGATTAVLDLLKAAVAAWLALYVMPDNSWLAVIAPTMAVIGHNYSIFLAERDEHGKIRLRGGAGGASTAGGAFGLWWASILIIVPVGVLVVYFGGYASVATLSVAILSIIIFAYRAWIGASPWQYSLYGVATLIILIIALRPNIKRLFKGTERVVGWRVRRNKNKKNK